MRGLIAACAACSVAVAALAQGPGPSLLDLHLGARFEVPSCPSGAGAQYPPVCATALMSTSYRDGPHADHHQILMEADRLPRWAGKFVAVVLKGEIVELQLFTRGEAVQAQALADITAKFGKPSGAVTREWVSLKDGRVQSVGAKWRGPNYEVAFEGVVLRADQGVLILARPRRAPPPSRPL